MRSDTFGRVAVKKLSAQRTSSPRASSRSHRWEPMNPAPPVTRTRRLLNIRLPHHSQELYNILESYITSCARYSYGDQAGGTPPAYAELSMEMNPSQSAGGVATTMTRTENPLVSVVIIFLNAEKFLQEAIASVLTQT